MRSRLVHPDLLASSLLDATSLRESLSLRRCLYGGSWRAPFFQFNIGHVWWVDSFTESIYGDADRCAHFVIKKSGKDFVIATQFISSE